MARPYRIQFDGAISHAVVTGTAGLDIFEDAEDVAHLVTMIGTSAAKHRAVVHAFCVAGESVEVLVETPHGNLSNFMQGFQTAYAQYFRKKYRCPGPIVRDRFRSKVVEPGSQLLALSAYIHTAPLRVPGCKAKTATQQRSLIKQHVGSSYGSYVGARNAVAFVEINTVSRLVKGAAKDRPKNYRSYVEAMLPEGDSKIAAAMEAHPLAIGSAAFQKEMDKLHNRFRAGRKPAQLRVYGKRKKGMPPAKVLKITAETLKIDPALFTTQRKNLFFRPIGAYMLYHYANLSQIEIAATIKVTSSAAVSLQMKRLMAAVQTDPELKKQLEKVQRALDKARK